MNNKNLYALLGVVALVIIGLIVYNQSNQDNTTLSNQNQSNNADLGNNNSATEISPLNNNTSSNANTNANNNTSGRLSDESDLDQGQIHQISYNGTAYSPSTMSIKAGDTVVFKNQSTGDFWPASANHPDHTKYPEFDPKKPIAAGETFQFKFLKTGDWGFHDHLRPSSFGKITVQ